MRFLKTIFLSVFIGFYFLSITPMHFYAHAQDNNHSNTQALDDCSYVNLLNFGQGNCLNPDVIDFISLEFPVFEWVKIIEFTSDFNSNFRPIYFNLRAPPYLNC